MRVRRSVRGQVCVAVEHGGYLRQGRCDGGRHWAHLVAAKVQHLQVCELLAECHHLCRQQVQGERVGYSCCCCRDVARTSSQHHSKLPRMSSSWMLGACAPTPSASMEPTMESLSETDWFRSSRCLLLCTRHRSGAYVQHATRAGQSNDSVTQRRHAATRTGCGPRRQTRPP